MKTPWMILLLFLCLPIFAQTKTPIPEVTVTLTPVDAASAPASQGSIPPPVLPQNFAGAGAAYNPIGSPKITGWASWGKLIDPKSETYVFTTEDAILVRSGSTFSVQTSLRVGIATKLKEFGPVKIFGIMDGGGATTGVATGGAASGGGIAEAKLGHSTYHFAAGFRIIKTQTSGGTPKMYEIGFFKEF